MTTFSLSDVELGQPMGSIAASSAIPGLMGRRVEAWDCATGNLVRCDTGHAFAHMAKDAFYRHYPIVIRPDDIWFCIAHGFATHIKQNAEALRDRLVSHQGKMRLVVTRGDFILGQDNPWPEAFDAFSQQIRANAGEAAQLVAARFSTSTALEVAAFDVCLMDGFQGYFEYVMMAGCGIPAVTVLGTQDDWLSMIPRLEAMAEYGLQTWVAALRPVLQRIAATAAGEVDKDFWLSFFRYQSGSGPAELTGWILTLFPYLIKDFKTKALGPNPYLADWQARFNVAQARTGYLGWGDEIQGPAISLVPEAMASAPVQLTDMRTGQKHDLLFVAGPLGVMQHQDTLALQTAFGWAVVHDEPVRTVAEEEPLVDEITGLWRKKPQAG